VPWLGSFEISAKKQNTHEDPTGSLVVTRGESTRSDVDKWPPISRIAAASSSANPMVESGAGSVLTHRAGPTSPCGKATPASVMGDSIVKIGCVTLMLTWIRQPFSPNFVLVN
jgi:hypothetical protein